MKTADLIIKNANEIVTLKGPNKPRIKEELSQLSIIKNGSLAIKDGKIIDIGKKLNYNSKKIINAKDKVILPGFIDPHTHLVFAESREFELDMKLKGFTYMDILKKGGGIVYTVEKTRKASNEELITQSVNRLDTMLKYGTTTCESKSGYGLEIKTEKKLLKVQKKLNENHPIDIISTFLGAHAVPNNLNSDEYTDIVVEEMIPEIKHLAKFCDVFCEKDVFSLEQSRRILNAGKKNGLIPKIHADEIVQTGGAELSAEVGSISADHLIMSSDKGFMKMSEKGVIGVLLPATPFTLMQKNFAPARKMINFGVPIALATDLNPNCWTENMQFIIQLACMTMKITPAEAITAATFNAACAIDMNDKIGSLEIGKQADIIVLNCPNYMFIPYHFGINLVDTVIKNGKII
jgi:imidazolonepropionase